MQYIIDPKMKRSNTKTMVSGVNYRVEGKLYQENMRLNRNIPIVTMATAMGQLLVVAEANQELATTTSCDKQKCGP